MHVEKTKKLNKEKKIAIVKMFKTEKKKGTSKLLFISFHI